MWKQRIHCSTQCKRMCKTCICWCNSNKVFFPSFSHFLSYHLVLLYTIFFSLLEAFPVGFPPLFIQTNIRVHTYNNIQCMGRWNLGMPTLQNKLLSRTSIIRTFSVVLLNFQNDSHPFVHRLYFFLFIHHTRY